LVCVFVNSKVGGSTAHVNFWNCKMEKFRANMFIYLNILTIFVN
jgi:hypothetical protein